MHENQSKWQKPFAQKRCQTVCQGRREEEGHNEGQVRGGSTIARECGVCSKGGSSVAVNWVIALTQFAAAATETKIER